MTTVMTAKGQIVIPARVRKHMNIKKGTRFSVIEKGQEIVLQPLTAEYFESMAGVLKTKGILTKALLEERRKEKEHEDSKWSKY